MKSKFSNPARRRRRHLSFNPSRQYVEDAVKEYLNEGGKITQLEAQPDSFKKDSWLTVEDSKEADDFLKEI